MGILSDYLATSNILAVLTPTIGRTRSRRFSIREVITTAVKGILPEKGIVWLRGRRERIFGPGDVHMILDDLENCPSPVLPEAFRVTSVKPGDEMDYVRVIRESLEEGADRAWYTETFQEDPEYDPRNLLIVRKGDIPVAVAAAWHKTWEGQRIGLIHNVGVDPGFRGAGLGRAVTLLALQRLRERGFERALLATEDHRIPAVSLYLSLGFRPLTFNWLHERRWMRILQTIRPATTRENPSVSQQPPTSAWSYPDSVEGQALGIADRRSESLS